MRPTRRQYRPRLLGDRVEDALEGVGVVLFLIVAFVFAGLVCKQPTALSDIHFAVTASDKGQ